MLEQLLAPLVKEERPDALIVAGDLYDRAVPPPKAVALLDDILTRLAELAVPVIAVAGNHDSAVERLSFGVAPARRARRAPARRPRRGAARADCHFPARASSTPAPTSTPRSCAAWRPTRSIPGHAAATERIVARARPGRRGQRTLPTVLLRTRSSRARAETPDSERPVVRRDGRVRPAAATLAGFDYVALGHLHAGEEAAPAAPATGARSSSTPSARSTRRRASPLVEVERGPRHGPDRRPRPPVERRPSPRQAPGSARSARSWRGTRATSSR